MQINLKVSVAITLWLAQETGEILQYLKLSSDSAKKLLVSAANKWSSNSDKGLAYFTFILLTKVSESINQYLMSELHASINCNQRWATDMSSTKISKRILWGSIDYIEFTIEYFYDL